MCVCILPISDLDGVLYQVLAARGAQDGYCSRVSCHTADHAEIHVTMCREAALRPAGGSLIAEMCPPEQRGIANGIFSWGVRIILHIASPCDPYIIGLLWVWVLIPIWYLLNSIGCSGLWMEGYICNCWGSRHFDSSSFVSGEDNIRN